MYKKLIGIATSFAMVSALLLGSSAHSASAAPKVCGGTYEYVTMLSSIDYFTDAKIELPSEVAAIIEDAFNAQWKAAVIFGWRLTMDESRTPGWYHGPITQGPESKPVCTGATQGLGWLAGSAR